MELDKLNWVDLDNSNVKAAAIDEQSSTLYVKFNSGAVYSYIGADSMIFNGLIGAESAGKYLAAVIKPKYAYTLVES